jgi:hypothetical protein
MLDTSQRRCCPYPPSVKIHHPSLPGKTGCGVFNTVGSLVNCKSENSQMPLKIQVRTPEDHAATNSRFDACVRRLAPIIRQLRENSAGRSTRKLATRLNGMGEVGPSGKPISYGTMRRILERLPQLHLGKGPSDRRRAAADRRTPYYPRLKKSNSSGFKGMVSDLEQAEAKLATAAKK